MAGRSTLDNSSFEIGSAIPTDGDHGEPGVAPEIGGSFWAGYSVPCLLGRCVDVDYLTEGRAGYSLWWNGKRCRIAAT